MYYILAIAFFVIGSSWQISDFAVLLLMLIAPSVFYNFKSMRSGQKGYGRIFALRVHDEIRVKKGHLILLIIVITNFSTSKSLLLKYR